MPGDDSPAKNLREDDKDNGGNSVAPIQLTGEFLPGQESFNGCDGRLTPAKNLKSSPASSTHHVINVNY